ncbi:MAG: ribbon-helix-helix protein, CopG family [Solirubrobacteraceae bacterium]|nr:ribbon-helix-helix protein, CopG family [Solirubrobacteraceae bacterium]
MSKVRTTLKIDEDVLRTVKIRAARTGRGVSEIIEASLRRDLGLGVIEDIWAHNDMGEDDAMTVALEAQAAARRGAAR